MFLENNIAYQNQTLSSEKLQALLLSIKEQNTQGDSWFYCKQVQEIPLRTPPETVVHQGQVDKGRSRRPEVFCKKGVSRIFTIFTGKHLCQSLFLNKVSGLRLAQVFSCEFCENSKNTFSIEQLWWMLLQGEVLPEPSPKWKLN